MRIMYTAANINLEMLLASNKQSRQRKSSSTMQPRQLYMYSFDKTDKNYEDLLDERGKKQRVFSNDSETDSESEFPNLMPITSSKHLLRGYLTIWRQILQKLTRTLPEKQRR